MHVGRIMKTDLVTVPPETSLLEAREILMEKKIAHLLVVDRNEKLLGVVSDRNLKESWASNATTLSVHELNYILEKLTVGMIMVKTILTVSPDTTIERAAHILQENRISALPVLEKEELVGIITTNDVLGIILQAIGINKESSRFSVLVKDRVGVMAEITKILKDHEINIRSLFTWPEREYAGVYQLVMRVNARDGEKAINTLTDHGYKVLTEYIKDLSPFLPGA
ncbi:MAG: CBS domain-containing protein [Deltaproteobacteria bacterium]|nr:CBS domain-containing protein [Deltaproteobacteria bacterium]